MESLVYYDQEAKANVLAIVAGVFILDLPPI